MTPEQAANRALQERGYLVIGTIDDGFAIGTIIPASSGPLGDLIAPTVIVAETDYSDFEEQHQMLFGDTTEHRPGERFWRVLAE